MTILKPVKSIEDVVHKGEHYQLVIFEELVIKEAQYPDEKDVKDIFSRIYVITNKEILKSAIERARFENKNFCVTLVKPVLPDTIAPDNSVKLGT